jgi:ribosomal protein S27AE
MKFTSHDGQTTPTETPSMGVDPVVIRIPPIPLSPTVRDQLRYLAEDLLFITGWTLIRGGLALLRREDPQQSICPKCGVLPTVNEDDWTCDDCGERTFTVAMTVGWFDGWLGQRR